ncbi:PadR family transcriptional regulator [Maribacter antarcticus]|uniref:PadR family transcriptional regulator n=1 Tax=Maribacter antarcticus TaxID=505250 RepID=UPI0004791C71|nr:PadR family transcriptional regulator [Maribacter antarcticus]
MTKDLLPELLSSWEDTYKKGQLTLWIFLALKDGQKYVDEIKEFIELKSNHTIHCEEQSLYRNLRKYQHIDVVAFENKKGNKGPDRKYYFLTPMGAQLLQIFIERNISLFFSTEILTLLKK